MVAYIDGQATEEFAINVAEYLQRQAIFKEAELQFELVKGALKEHMEIHGLTEVEVGDHVVTLKEITRESLDTKSAKVVIPKKYLPEVLKTTHYTQLKVAVKKE